MVFDGVAQLSRLSLCACRREGYEVAVGPPQVITKEVEGRKCEPYEEAHVEVPQEHMGQVCL
jgi:predicted membrane GTPase involved in stress response